jgi:hypothetical protein
MINFGIKNKLVEILKNVDKKEPPCLQNPVEEGKNIQILARKKLAVYSNINKKIETCGLNCFQFWK